MSLTQIGLDAAHRLAHASDWASFRLSHGEDACLELVATQAGRTWPTPDRAEELLQTLVPVLARGMQLLSEQQLHVHTLKQHEAGMWILENLCTVSTGPLLSLGAFTADYAAQERLQLAVLMTRAGMIPAHKQLTRAITRLISSPDAQQQQQQQQQQGAPASAALQHSGIPHLIFGLLSLLSGMLSSWPGERKSLSNQALAAAVPAAAELAVAALRNKSAHHTQVTRRSRATTTAYAAVNLAHLLPDDIASSSSSVMQLKMCWLALTAQAVHKQQHGLSPAAAGGLEPAAAGAHAEAQQRRQQRLAVPAYHQQLLQALGLPATGGSQLHMNALSLLDVYVRSAATSLAYVRFEDRGSSSSSSSSSAATPGPQQQSAGAAVDVALLAPLLLVLLECCALQPANSAAAVCVWAMAKLLSSCKASDAIPCRALLLQGVPQLLVPAIKHAKAAAAATADDAAGAAAATHASALAENAGILLLNLLNLSIDVSTSAMVDPGNARMAVMAAIPEDAALSRSLAALFLQEPGPCFALLEAGVRSLTHTTASADAVPELVQVPLMAAAFAARQRNPAMVLSAAAQQQVFSLLISSLKASEVAAAAGSGAHLPSAGVVMHAGPALLMHSSSSGSSKSTRQVTVHLLARALVTTGRGLQHLDSSRGSSSSALGHIRATDTLAAIAAGLERFASELPQLSPALPGPALQRLLDEQAALLPQVTALQALRQQVPEPQAQLPLAAATASVCEQLEAFGAAVVAQVPVKNCCNNHGCTNSSQDSELELVGGKSCVCSGCLAARYCSRECQVAHYKHWHRAVCKRLRQQRQQQQQQS